MVLEQEQKEPRVEALRLEAKDINARLNNLLGPGNFAIRPNGEIRHRFSDLELINLGKTVPEEVGRAADRLREIYAELRELGFLDE